MALETRNYTLGRGEVHFAKFGPGQVPGGERYLGNTPAFGFSAEVENLDHYNSDRGIREKDESIILQVDRAGAITCDNISMENLAMFWFGESSLVTVVAATAQTETLTGVSPGLGYQLGISDAAPAGLRKVDNVVLSADVGGTPTPLVEGTDFTLDAERGRVTFIDGGAVEDGTAVEATYDVGGYTMPRVISGDKPIEGALRFIAYNPAGKQIDYYLPWVKITPSGDYELKGDDWQQMTFDMEILKKPGREAVYADGEPTAIP